MRAAFACVKTNKGIKSMTIKQNQLRIALLEYIVEDYENTKVTREPFVKQIKEWITSRQPYIALHQSYYDTHSPKWMIMQMKGKEFIIESPIHKKVLKERETSERAIKNWRISFDGNSYTVQYQSDSRCHWNDHHKTKLTCKRAWELMTSLLESKGERYKDEYTLNMSRVTCDLEHRSAYVGYDMVKFYEGKLYVYYNSNQTEKIIIDLDDVDDAVEDIVSVIYSNNTQSIK
jgi:hypothetical protein